MRTLKITVICTIAVGLLAGSAIGVAAQDADPAAPSVWSGQLVPAQGEQISFEETPTYLELLGRDSGQIEASDPRISGDWEQVLAVRVFDPEGDGAVLQTATIRVENDGGSWSGTYSGWAGGPSSQGWNVLTGEGGYEGLTAVFSQTAEGALEGLIVPGVAPAAPEAPPAE